MDTKGLVSEEEIHSTCQPICESHCREHYPTASMTCYGRLYRRPVGTACSRFPQPSQCWSLLSSLLTRVPPSPPSAECGAALLLQCLAFSALSWVASLYWDGTHRLASNSNLYIYTIRHTPPPLDLHVFPIPVDHRVHCYHPAAFYSYIRAALPKLPLHSIISPGSHFPSTTSFLPSSPWVFLSSYSFVSNLASLQQQTQETPTAQ